MRRKTVHPRKRTAVRRNKLIGSISTGTIFIAFILIILILAAVFLTGGTILPSQPDQNATPVVITKPSSFPTRNDLQLYTFKGVTVTPTPIVPTQQPALCQNKSVNTEPEILVGYSPAQGQTVGAGGQVKVWVTDENPPCVGTGEVANPSTGFITTSGNHTEKSSDGYLWEPALYISPNLAENGGTPFFPTQIKGIYNNGPKSTGGSLGESFCDTGNNAPLNGPVIDPAPGPKLDNTAEYIWDVNSLKLAPGTYSAEFVIHDGDRDRGIGCTTITIQ